MGIGRLAKKVIQEYPIAFTISFLLLSNNVANYCTTKYIRLNYIPNAQIEAQKVLDEYDKFGIAQCMAWGSYKAAQEVLRK